MKLSEYQKAAIRTMDSDLTYREALGTYGLWLCSEAGEVAKQVEKVLNTVDHPSRLAALEKMRDELGDTLWCVATLAHLLGSELNAIGAENIDKLKERWPRGFRRDPR